MNDNNLNNTNNIDSNISNNTNINNISNNDTLNNYNNINNDIYSNNEENQKREKKFKKFFPLVIVIAIVVMVKIVIPALNDKSSPLINSKNSFSKMIDTMPKDENTPYELPYHSTSYYFNYKDKLYYYEHKKNENNLYIMDVDGNNKELITSNNELILPSFYLVYNNEAYFYSIEGYHTEIPKSNNKINLKTGEITNLGNDYSFIPYTLKDGKIISEGNLNLSDSSTFRIYNLENNTIEFEKKVEYDYRKSTIYDYSTGDLYAFSRNNYSDNNVTITIYKNDIEMGNFVVNNLHKNKLNESMIILLYANNGSVFLTDKTKIYKYNTNTNELTTTNDVDLLSYAIVKSNNPNNLYIYNNRTCYLYELDQENATLNKLFKVIGEFEDTSNDELILKYRTNIFENDSKLVLIEHSIFEKLKADEDPLDTVNIYDKKTKELSSIENVRSSFYDYENNIIYLYVKKDNNYYSKKIEF